MKITKNELDSILQELKLRHYKYDKLDCLYYEYLSDSIYNYLFKDMQNDKEIYVLNAYETFRLVEVGIIKIIDNKLILNIK